MILVIDNYDSFVFNLARFVQLSGHKTQIIRNDKITLKEIEALKPEAIILSPGPKTPKDAGICIDIIKTLGQDIPILGVCLGHQAIGEAFGGQTKRHEPMHGKSTEITHSGENLFQNLHNPMHVGRYHSLISQNHAPDLIIDAKTKNGTPMAMHHKDFPIYGVQFHPESILTPQGLQIIQNFSAIVKVWNQKKAA